MVVGAINIILQYNMHIYYGIGGSSMCVHVMIACTCSPCSSSDAHNDMYVASLEVSLILWGDRNQEKLNRGSQCKMTLFRLNHSLALISLYNRFAVPKIAN